MLTNEQINHILENRISDLGRIRSIAGVLPVVNPLTDPSTVSKAAAQGAKLGAKIISTDHKKDSLKISDQSKIYKLIKEYFKNSLVFEKHKNDVYFLVGVKNSGFLNMNFCVLEILLKHAYLEIFAHAKEGFIKQGTCVKAINTLKKYLTNSQ